MYPNYRDKSLRNSRLKFTKTENTFFNTNLFNFSNTTNAYISCQKQENFCCDIRSPIVLGQIMVSNELAFADFAKIILLFIFFYYHLFYYLCTLTVETVKFYLYYHQPKYNFTP